MTFSPMQLLIFDDSPSALFDIRLKVKRLFPKAKMNTTIDFATAVEYLDTKQLDLALIDLYMSGKNGVDFINDHIRKHRKYAELPVIVVSAFKSDDALGRPLRETISDYIHKPIDLGLLNTAINKVFSTKISDDE